VEKKKNRLTDIIPNFILIIYKEVFTINFNSRRCRFV